MCCFVQLTSTSNYGYVAKDGDIWIYTGITSVNGDSSNIGSLLANKRTGEAHYYSVAGADEYSAMSAAKGEVQEKGYNASFPSLINVEGEPTYIMVLKDASGIVKMYAAVNVAQYNIVATATSQEECLEKYKTLLSTKSNKKEDVSEEVQEISIEVSDVQSVVIDGNTYIYLITPDQKMYRGMASEHESLLLINPGSIASIKCKGEEIISVNN